MASIPACHAGDRGSIPRDGVLFFPFSGPWQGRGLSLFICCPSSTKRNPTMMISYIQKILLVCIYSLLCLNFISAAAPDASKLAMGVAPDRFVSAGPLIVGAECSDGTLLVAVHTIFADEPLLLDEEVAVEDKAVAKAQTLQPLPREYRGPFRVYVVDSLGTSMACVGWRADGQILAKYCRYLAKEEKDLFGVSRSSYGSYLALETSSWMARCAVSGRVRRMSACTCFLSFVRKLSLIFYFLCS